MKPPTTATEMPAREMSTRRTPGEVARLVTAAVCCGVCAGLVAMVMALFIDTLEQVVFHRGITSGWLGTSGVPTARVLLGLSLGGLAAGTIWWRIRPATGSLPSVESAVQGHRLGVRSVIDAFTQLLVVGTGSSIGKEVAPRQVSAWAAQYVGRWWRLDADRPLLVAASAGAGLAAVYNTPLAGAVLTVEMLLRPDLRTLRGWAVAGIAVLTSAVATVTAWPVVTSRPTYDVVPIHVHGRAVLGALAIAALAEPLASAFSAVVALGRRHIAAHRHQWFSVALVGLAVGLVALRAPQVVGNGRPMVQLAIDHPAAASTLALLVVVKLFATALTFAGGATGGVITPALAVGAGMGGALDLWLAPHADSGTRALCAIAGAATVLALTQGAPLFALVFTLELCHPQVAAMGVIALGVGVGVGVRRGRRAALAAWRDRHAMSSTS